MSASLFPKSFKPGEIGPGDVVDLSDVQNVTVVGTSFLSLTAKVKYYDPLRGGFIIRNVNFHEIYGHRTPKYTGRPAPLTEPVL